MANARPPKVIPRMFGGLGNQLFIYAAARRLSLVNGAELVIDDVSGFRSDRKYRRQYMLDRFDISARKASPGERMEPFPRLRRYVKQRLSQRRPFLERTYIQQRGVDYDPRLLKVVLRGTTYLEGYWQSEQYFQDIEDTIRRDLFIPAPEDQRNRSMAERMAGVESVALHVRFFDTPETGGGNDAPEAYYRRAIDRLEGSRPGVHYFVFSDKPAAALSRLPLDADRVTVVDHNMGDHNAHLDLWLMSRCRHMIMANSTFSWWGAWLGEKPDRCVVAPGFEVREGIMSWGFRGLLPDRWIKV